MDHLRAYSFTLLFILTLVSLHTKVIYGDSSVFLLDSSNRNYFRHSAAQNVALSPSEVGATASVLLGFAPPSTLTAASSSKLNEVLKPNPFDRPRAVLMLEVTGAEYSLDIPDSDKSTFGNALRLKVVGDDQRVGIQLQDDDEVSLVSLDEVSSNAQCSDNEISDFATWLDGSYVEDATKPLNGELVLPVANGAFLRLRMSERADREFTTSLLFVIKNIRSAIDMHQVLTKSEHNPAELIAGRFDGIKALQDHYGKDGVAQKALEVFVISISKAFDSLLAAYEGKIVGFIVHGGPRASEFDSILRVTVASPSLGRSLQEAESPSNLTKMAEVAFVRTTLAWTTGIILLIATLLGILFLLNMPLTKDTLLYSNVKLD